MATERRKEMRAHRDLLQAYEYKIKLLEAQLKMVRWDLQRLLATMTPWRDSLAQPAGVGDTPAGEGSEGVPADGQQ